METMRMTAIGTSEKRSYYILVKEALTEKPLNEIMEKIGYGILYYGKEEGISDSHSPTGFENCVDHVVTGKYDIDIVYTVNRIVLIVRAPKEQQEKFKDLMLAYSKMEE
ncbi:hypothetical protein COU58_04520 [Candidatus Pacearchaeota archaeon CG10_big_fil_rev_8_21_14_0_10_32_42]|nr:MAG: hypothetical protein COU58_04520 [Candidatus Pacearchaeota archaeon CG10_big_fil_rev_8_21_14_0_10_32_42]